MASKCLYETQQDHLAPFLHYNAAQWIIHFVVGLMTLLYILRLLCLFPGCGSVFFLVIYIDLTIEIVQKSNPLNIKVSTTLRQKRRIIKKKSQTNFQSAFFLSGVIIT